MYIYIAVSTGPGTLEILALILLNHCNHVRMEAIQLGTVLEKWDLMISVFLLC